MKKKYTFNLDQEAVDELQGLLKASNCSLSGFIDTMVKEQVAVMKMVGPAADVNKMTLGDLGGLLSRLARGLKE